MPEVHVRGQPSAHRAYGPAGGQREVRGQKSEGRGQKSEVRSQNLDVRRRLQDERRRVTYHLSKHRSDFMALFSEAHMIAF